jgi:aminoglycoside phosphotransferase (APT) family kinase protein
MVKLATGYGQRGVVHEGLILDALEPIARPPLRIPRCTGFSPDLGMLALEWIDGATTAYDHHRTTRQYDPDLANRLGRALGALHARTHADPARFVPQDDSARADLLESLLRPRPAFYARQPRAALHLISRLQHDDAAMRSLQSLSDVQQDSPAGCLLHGDCKQGNVLLAGGDPVLIDWELALWGDGARDLGWLAADYATGWLAPQNEAEVLPQQDLQRFLGALLHSYALERGSAYPVPLDLSARVVRWCGLALVVMAYAEAHLLRTLEDRGKQLADFGQYLLAEPDGWRSKLFGGGP